MKRWMNVDEHERHGKNFPSYEQSPRVFGIQAMKHVTKNEVIKCGNVLTSAKGVHDEGN